GGRAVSGRRAPGSGLRLGSDRHRRRAGVSSQAALPLPLLHARLRPSRPAMSDQSRSVATNRRRHHRRTAQNQGRQRQSAARAGAGAGRFSYRETGARKPPKPDEPQTSPGEREEETPMNPADLVSAFPPGERTVPAMLQRQAQRYGNRPLFVAGEVSWSFAEAPAIAAGGPQLTHYLRNSGARLLIIEAEFLDALAYIDAQELELERIWCVGDTR